MLLILITLNITKGEQNKNLSPKEHLNIVRPHLSDMINDHQTKSNNANQFYFF